MGTGEPFDNYDNFIKFIEIANELKDWISDNGKSRCLPVELFPGYMILQIMEARSILLCPCMRLDKSRSKIMPINKRYPIERTDEGMQVLYKEDKPKIII